MTSKKFWIIIALLIIALPYAAFAQSPLGIGGYETALKPTGFFALWIQWLNEQQKNFYFAMTQALKRMGDNPCHSLVLVGLSFAYGIFHAAGPGHGKAVISSYLIANETALRRGILLSFISSMLQAVSAVLIVSAAWFLLRGTGISMNSTTRTMEIASFALITIFGLILFFKKLPKIWKQVLSNSAPSQPLQSAAQTQEIPAQSTTSFGKKAVVRLHYAKEKAEQTGFNHSFVGNSDICTACGNSHIVSPELVTEEFNWKTAWSAIIAVGLRPCTGALIVLTFAMLNGIIIGGLLSVFAMALGTFITVATLATLAVTTKNFALRFANNNAKAMRIQALIEALAALFIVLFGTSLLIAALLYS